MIQLMDKESLNTIFINNCISGNFVNFYRLELRHSDKLERGVANVYLYPDGYFIVEFGPIT